MIISPRAPASISHQALYLYLGNAVFDTPEQSIPNNLMHEELPTTPQIDIEEYANGVVHPVTKETITTYKTLIEDPFLKNKWKKAICVELGRLTQGYQDIPGTNTIKTNLINTTRGTVPASAVKKTTAHQDPQETPRHPREQQTSEGGRWWTNEGGSGGINVGQHDITEDDCENPVCTSTTNPQQYSSAKHSGGRGRDRSLANLTIPRPGQRCRQVAR